VSKKEAENPLTASPCWLLFLY